MTDGEETGITESPITDGAEKNPSNRSPFAEFLGRGTKNKKQTQLKSQIDEQIDIALAKSALQEKKTKKRKVRFKLALYAAGFVVLSFITYKLFKPYEGGMAFGVCKVFLENSVRYPDHLRLSTVEDFETSVRIWYTQVDAFGSYRMEPIQCYFKQDPERGTILEKVLVNRREVSQKTVDSFNNVIPTIVAYPPDLTLPSPLADSLEGMDIQTQKFRKPTHLLGQFGRK